MQELLTLRQQLHALERETQQSHLHEVTSTPPTPSATVGTVALLNTNPSSPVCCRPSRS